MTVTGVCNGGLVQLSYVQAVSVKVGHVGFDRQNNVYLKCLGLDSSHSLRNTFLIKHIYILNKFFLVSLGLSSNNFTLKVIKVNSSFNTRYLVNSLNEISTMFNADETSSVKCPFF